MTTEPLLSDAVARSLLLCFSPERPIKVSKDMFKTLSEEPAIADLMDRVAINEEVDVIVVPADPHIVDGLAQIGGKLGDVIIIDDPRPTVVLCAHKINRLASALDGIRPLLKDKKTHPTKWTGRK